MKRILMLALILSSVQVMGQTPTFRPYQSLPLASPQKSPPTDSTIKVVYIDEFKELHTDKETAIFLNGKYVNTSILSTLYPSFIDSMYVINESITIDRVSYLRQYYFITKGTYTPKLISLNDMKDKYVNLKTKRTIFMLDGTIIDAEYDTYMVDENNIFQILVETMRNTKRNRDISFIKLLTRSSQNIKISKEIRIRGSEVSMNK